jgi:hypothetical protein
LIATAALLTYASFSTAQLRQYVGTYECIRIEKGKRVDNKTLPPGQVMRLELHAEGNWVMRNMLIGYDGTWHMTGRKLVLITANGPNGKVKKPDKLILVPKPDRRLLVLASPQKMVGQIEFRFAPKLMAELAKRVKGLKP